MSISNNWNICFFSCRSNCIHQMVKFSTRHLKLLNALAPSNICWRIVIFPKMMRISCHCPKLAQTSCHWFWSGQNTIKMTNQLKSKLIRTNALIIFHNGTLISWKLTKVSIFYRRHDFTYPSKAIDKTNWNDLIDKSCDFQHRSHGSKWLYSLVLNNILFSIIIGSLFELIKAANYLEIPNLVDVACKTVANMIKGKSPEQIRETFHIKDGFSADEQEQINKEKQMFQ